MMCTPIYSQTLKCSNKYFAQQGSGCVYFAEFRITKYLFAQANAWEYVWMLKVEKVFGFNEQPIEND